MSEHTAENGATHLPWRRQLSLAWNRCIYCGHDRRAEACCGIVYLPDRMDEPPPTRSHTGRRCDCDRCMTRPFPPGSSRGADA